MAEIEEAAMKTFIFLGLTTLVVTGCTDTIVMQGKNNQTDTCQYSLMYRSLHQCVATDQQDGMTAANGPAWWNYDR